MQAVGELLPVVTYPAMLELPCWSDGEVPHDVIAGPCAWTDTKLTAPAKSLVGVNAMAVVAVAVAHLV